MTRTGREMANSSLVSDGFKFFFGSDADDFESWLDLVKPEQMDGYSNESSDESVSGDASGSDDGASGKTNGNAEAVSHTTAVSRTT